MLSLSFTKIEKFLRCPQEYKWYINKDLYRQHHKESPPLVFGSIMHGIFNDYYKVLTKEERTQERLIALFKQKYNANKIKHDQVFKSQEILGQYAKMASKEFTNFLNSQISQQVPYVATEENIKTDLGGVELISKIDRIDTSAKGLKIIDYKTGRFVDEEPDPLQLDLYALSAFLKFPEIPLHQKIYYYLFDNKFIEVEASKGEYKKTREKVLQIAEDIAIEKTFAPVKNKKCNWCDFRSICTLWQ